jgi:hypothetical protein
MNDIATFTAKKTPAELIEDYIALRDQRTNADDKFKEFRKLHFDAPMEAIEVQLLDILNSLGVDSLAGGTGTAYKKISVSVTTADAREFRRHVIGDEQWDLVDWRPNKTAVNDLVEKGEPVPPGVNRSAFYTIGVRKGK